MPSSNVVQLRGVRELPRNAPKTVRSTTEAVILSQEAVRAWKAPPFQRPLRINHKVGAVAEDLKLNGGILPGILTVGVLDRDKYLVDGQHRVEAFKISELAEVYAEIRICHFDTLADMSDEFVTLNSRLVNMRPDDILRGLEASYEGLRLVRHHCPFVGYDNIRRSRSAAMVSMSAMLRCWSASTKLVPGGGGEAAADLARIFTKESAMEAIQFLNVAYGAWGTDGEYGRLWGNLNLALTMWFWRNMVVGQYGQKTTKLSVQLFAKCLMGQSADGTYIDWLMGRHLTERDRSPAFARSKAIFTTVLKATGVANPIFPRPAWVH